MPSCGLCGHWTYTVHGYTQAGKTPIQIKISKIYFLNSLVLSHHFKGHPPVLKTSLWYRFMGCKIPGPFSVSCSYSFNLLCCTHIGLPCSLCVVHLSHFRTHICSSPAWNAPPLDFSCLTTLCLQVLNKELPPYRGILQLLYLMLLLSTHFAFLLKFYHNFASPLCQRPHASYRHCILALSTAPVLIIIVIIIIIVNS